MLDTKDHRRMILMAIYKEQISDRLNDFLVGHSDCEDVGCNDYGPKVECHYNGPDWAIDLADKAFGVFDVWAANN